MEVQQLGTESIPPLGTLVTHNQAKYILKLCLILRIGIATKGGSDLVWYSIDRDIFKPESIFL